MDEVAEVKNRLEITEVVGSYLPLKQAGRNLKAPCPFHDEKSASFMVSPDKGIYHCFGCGEGGDIFNFVMKMEGLDFRQALEMLARKAGVELKERAGDGGAAKKLRERLLEAHELAVKFYQLSLVKNPKASEYVVRKRGLNKQTISDFQIGYAPDSWNGLTDVLAKKGFTTRELTQGGLAGQREGRSTVYDLFRGRVMFTICDREGRPIGFTGRVLDDSVPKYLNTPQTPLYDKSQVIFGLHLAKEAIRLCDEVVLVEGQMDVVASHQAGVKQVVATSGTALTLDHLRALSKLTKNIKLSFDADRAGLAATERAIELGQKLGLMIRMVEMPEGVKDADELIGRDVEAWKQAIAGAKYIVDYLFDRFEAQYDLHSTMGKRQYTDRLAGTLQRLGDPVEQRHYIKLLADKVGVAEDAVRARVQEGKQTIDLPESKNKRLTAEGDLVRRAVVQVSGKPSMRMQREELFLGLNLLYPEVRVFLHDLAEEQFSSDERRAIYKLLVKAPQTSAEELAGKMKDSAGVNRLVMIAEAYLEGITTDIHSEAFNLAKAIFKESKEEFLQLLKAQMKQAAEQQDEILREKLADKAQRLVEAQGRFSL